MVEIILWSTLSGLSCGAVGFVMGGALCRRREHRRKTSSTTDGFLALLRH
jgi:hypothetical protein